VYSGDDRESFDALSGRDLDAAVARHVFDLEVEARTDRTCRASAHTGMNGATQ